VLHHLLVSDIVVNLLLRQFLIIFHEVHQRCSKFTSKLTVIVLCLTYELKTHFVNLRFSCKRLIIGCKVVFNWRILTAPGQDGIHIGVLISEVLLQTVQSFLDLAIVWVGGHVTLLSLGQVRLARVARMYLLVLTAMQHGVDLMCLLISLCKFFCKILHIYFCLKLEIKLNQYI